MTLTTEPTALMQQAGELVHRHIPEARYLFVGHVKDSEIPSFLGVYDDEYCLIHAKRADVEGSKERNLPASFDGDIDSLVQGSGTPGQGWGAAIDPEFSELDETGRYEKAIVDLDWLDALAALRSRASRNQDDSDQPRTVS